MSRRIAPRELRNEIGDIMREMDRGETFVVTRNGVPVGEFTPLRRHPHPFTAADAAVAIFRNAPPVDSDRLRADLDSAVTQDVSSRG